MIIFRISFQMAGPMKSKRDPEPDNHGMSLSITNNMDVLRTKLLREIIHRYKVQMNDI